jgi:hypothetical protein
MDTTTTLLDVADELKNVRATLEAGRPTFNELEDLWPIHMDAIMSTTAAKVIHVRDMLTDVRAMLTMVWPTVKEARM